MELYKKKSLKFSYNQVTREGRHAETLGARESSRFKRLSILRSMDEESNENKSVEPVACEEKKKPMSRLEMLFKWKQDKQIRKEQAKKNYKKPFYTGGQSLKSNCSMKPPAMPSQPARVLSMPKKTTSGASFQSSRIPNHSKTNGAKVNGTNIDAVLTKKPTRALGNSVVSKASQGSIPTIAKGKIEQHTAKSTPVARNGNFLKPNSQTSFLPKPNFSKQPSKPLSKTGIPTFSKGIPAPKTQNRVVKKPATSINKKTEPVSLSKPHREMAPSLTKNLTTRKKEYCSTTATKKQDNIKKNDEKTVTSKIELMKKTETKDESDVNTQSIEIESLYEQGLESVPDMIFNCDVSIIKPLPSFAPINFKFVPPAELPDFTFDEEAFQRIKMKFLSRTSTPSKPSKKSSSPTPETSCMDSPLVDKVNLSQKMMVSQAAVESGIPDQSISKENIVEKEIHNHCKDVLKNSANEEECDVKRVSDLTNRHGSLPREGENKPAMNELLKTPVDVCIDSPLLTVDLNKIREIANQVEIMKLEEEELSDIELLGEQDADKCPENKPLIAPPKRASMLKNIPVLNSIAEMDDECIAQTPTKCSKSKQNFVNRRGSQRLSKVPIMEESPVSGITVTPRRSMRLQCIAAKKCQFGDKDIVSPADKCKSKIPPRRSMRLIDLNTPEKDMDAFGAGKTDITFDFKRLHLNDSENMVPEALIDFNFSPAQVPKPKPKKISLLYSPEKPRNSVRRSIKGDLMSFSPSN